MCLFRVWLSSLVMSIQILRPFLMSLFISFVLFCPVKTGSHVAYAVLEPSILLNIYVYSGSKTLLYIYDLQIFPPILWVLLVSWVVSFGELLKTKLWLATCFIPALMMIHFCDSQRQSTAFSFFGLFLVLAVLGFELRTLLFSFYLERILNSLKDYKNKNTQDWGRRITWARPA
jgi:hypothetical protein